MMREVQITVNECVCDKCGYKWYSFIGDSAPIFCPNLKCRTRQWNGKGKTSYINQIKLPAPRKQGHNRTHTFDREE